MGVIVAEPKIEASQRNRRLQKRFPLPAGAGADLRI